MAAHLSQYNYGVAASRVRPNACACLMTSFICWPLAMQSKQSGAVQLLLQYGAELTAKNTRAGSDSTIPAPGGSTPLVRAAACGQRQAGVLLACAPGLWGLSLEVQCRSLTWP